MKKFISVILIMITIISAVSVPTYAATEPEDSTSVVVLAVDPRLNNGVSCTPGFLITGSGLANVTVEYSGISGVTTKVTSTVYIQKKFLGLFWTRVDIGTTNDEWVDSSTNVNGYFSHTVQLESTGTYRAVFVITMAGSGGATDEIEKKIEKKYS